MNIVSPIYHNREALLSLYLSSFLNLPGQDNIDFVKKNIQWIELPAGQTLITQGEPGNSAYFSVSGRLRVYVTDENGKQRMVRELGRGEVIGEMSLYTGGLRSATVVAIRNTVLAKLDKANFEALISRSPQASIEFTRQIIGRLQTQNLRQSLPAPVTVALLPISNGVSLLPFAQSLAKQLAPFGRICMVDSAAIEQLLGTPGISTQNDPDSDRLITMAIDRLEAEHDFILLVPHGDADVWTRRCITHGDELLLMADATQPPELHPVELACLAGKQFRSEAAEILVLLYPAGHPVPRGSHRWIARRPVTGHVNIRPDLERDMARLARLLSRNAVGLVLGGGGARGFAHLGVWRALCAHGIEIDYVGGASIGAIMAGPIASDAPVEKVIDVMRKAFKVNPTGDYNLLPLISIIKGRRTRLVIEHAINELFGGPVNIEDMWKGYYCIAGNYSQGCEQCLDKGDLSRALRASIAIPGALPPVVHNNCLLCDGGTFNNFPVDTMRTVRGVGRVIGVNLDARQVRRLDFDEVPDSWTLLWDRLKPRSKRRFKLPSLPSYLLNVTFLHGISHRQEAMQMTDLCFVPPLSKVGLLQWSQFDSIMHEGEKYATGVLQHLSDSQKRAFGLKS